MEAFEPVRLLIVVAVSALTAIVAVFLLEMIHGPWSDNSSIRTAIAGGLAGLVSVAVSRNLRKRES